MMKAAHLHEECGVFGIWSPDPVPVAGLVYYGLYALQHRGQESAGIVLNDDGVFSVRKGSGLVSEVFHGDELRSLGTGRIGVGHVRYATTGSDSERNIQPLVVNHGKGHLALAHNGNLTNSFELRSRLEAGGAIFHSSTDSEVISYVIVQQRLRLASIEEAVSAAMNIVRGAYSLVISSPAKLIAVRDPNGFRPLCYGKRPDGGIVFASESCALDAVGAAFVRDLLPGEIAVVENGDLRFHTSHCGSVQRSLCVFEYIYFARPDSVIDGMPVSAARRRAGAYLAEEHPVEADAVIGVPDSGLDAALGYSVRSGIPYAIGFTKNKYIGRTFISPEQSVRENGVRIKLNPVREAVANKRIVLVDDSIVRGTTSRRIIDLLREAGAAEIHMRISSPPFIAPCCYGTDVDDAGSLIANRHTENEIARMIGADSLGYLSTDHVRQLADGCPGFCTACFGGGYPVSPPAVMKKSRFEEKISQKKDPL